MNWQQLRTMLWLRWRLTNNQWERRSPASAIISFIGMFLGFFVMIAGGVGGVLGGSLGLKTASPVTVMIAWDVAAALFLFLWTMGVVTELQRSEIIDLSRLLHLPVALRDVFILNYIASHLSFTLALMVPALLGLSVGMVFGRGPLMLLLIPAVVAFFFMITAWTYCLRGWLAALMNNQRRRRTVIMVITLVFLVASQLPNLLFNTRFSRRQARALQAPLTAEDAQAEDQKVTNTFEQANRIVPLLWLPMSAWSLAEGNAWPAIGGALGMFAIGALGLRRAYRSTIRFYQGGDTRQKIAAAAPLTPIPVNGRRLLVERKLPWVPEEAAALALMNFRSLTRAPEVKLALGGNVFIFGMLGMRWMFDRTTTIPPAVVPWLAPVAAIGSLFGMGQLLFNQFGFDREGFRTLVLLPTSRRLFLLGKNLSLLPVALLLFLIFFTLISLLAHPHFLILLVALLDLGTAFLIMSLIGNFISIWMAYRIAPGSMKPTKTSASTALVVGFSQLLCPLAMAPLFVPVGLGWLGDHHGWLPGSVVMLAASALLLGLAALVYWKTLPAMGDWLQRREQKILLSVTQEQE